MKILVEKCITLKGFFLSKKLCISLWPQCILPDFSVLDVILSF